MQPIGRYGLENGGPELEMGSPVGFAFDRWQAGLATQGLWREHHGNLAQPEADSGNLPVPPSLRHLVVFEADQCHAERTAVAVAVEVDAGVTVAEHGPVPEPVRPAVSNLEAEFFEEAERILYLTVPPICFRDSKPRHPLMLCTPGAESGRRAAQLIPRACTNRTTMRCRWEVLASFMQNRWQWMLYERAKPVIRSQ